jgi:hypothetical protein
MKNLFKALAAFQQEVPTIHKGTQGYGYTFADLPSIFEVINPLLKKHGLGFTQPIMGDCVKTIVFHSESGESIESLTQIPKNVQLKGQNEFQVLGSAITYIRRYSISAALGIVTDKDTDAGGEQVKKETTEDKGFAKPTTWLNKYSDKANTKITEEWNKTVAWLLDVEDLNQFDAKINKLKVKYLMKKENLAELIAMRP